MKYSLSLNNAQKIAIDKYENNFTFIVGDQEYQTNRFVADILSPIINEAHYHDESINEFRIQIKNGTETSKQETYFNEFLQLARFQAEEIDEEKRLIFSDYFLQLGNIDEYFKLQQTYFTDISVSNVISRLKALSCNNIKKYITGSEEKNLHTLINFASEHFCDIDKEELITVEAGTLAKIIDNSHLRLNTEDELIEIVLQKYKEEPEETSNLFEYIEFKALSEESIEQFIEKFDIEYLTRGTWLSICGRLCKSKIYESRIHHQTGENRKEEEKEKEEESSKKTISIEHQEGREFSGIMKHLSESTGGNIHDNGTIEITSNSIYCYDDGYHPKNLVNYNQSPYTFYHSNGDANTYIRFDFKDKKIQVDSYSIQSYNYGPNCGHLRNWVLEVSNDSDHWEVIDSHSNDSSLNGGNIIKTFHTNKSESFYRFVQIRQTGQSWRNDYYVYFPYVEFYGKLKQP